MLRTEKEKTKNPIQFSASSKGVQLKREHDLLGQVETLSKYLLPLPRLRTTTFHIPPQHYLFNFKPHIFCSIQFHGILHSL